MNSQYNTLTTPITTDVFHARVRSLLSNHLYNDSQEANSSQSTPTVPCLSIDDTYLAPEGISPQLLGVVSPWINLCSPDPAVYDISRQVLKLEVAFAAFCGLNALVLPAPRLHPGTRGGITRYATAAQEALDIGCYIHFSLRMPIMDSPEDVASLAEGSNLSDLERPQYAPNKSGVDAEASRKHDFFGSWDAWNVVRSLCRYNARLLVGKVSSIPLIGHDRTI